MKTSYIQDWGFGRERSWLICLETNISTRARTELSGCSMMKYTPLFQAYHRLSEVIGFHNLRFRDLHLRHSLDWHYGAIEKHVEHAHDKYVCQIDTLGAKTPGVYPASTCAWGTPGSNIKKAS